MRCWQHGAQQEQFLPPFWSLRLSQTPKQPGFPSRPARPGKACSRTLHAGSGSSGNNPIFGHRWSVGTGCSGLTDWDAFNLPRSGQLSEPQTKRCKEHCVFLLMAPRGPAFLFFSLFPPFISLGETGLCPCPDSLEKVLVLEKAKRERLEGGSGKGIHQFMCVLAPRGCACLSRSALP